MIELFKQVNKAGSVFLLGILMMAVGLTACNENGDVLETGTRPDQLMLMACPLDYHNAMEGQVRGAAEKIEPIYLKGDNSTSMRLTNRTGRTINLGDVTVLVQTDGPFTNDTSLFRLKLGQVQEVQNGGFRTLHQVCGQTMVQSAGDISIFIGQIDVDVALLTSNSSLPFHFHLIIKGSEIQTIDQEVIWNL